MAAADVEALGIPGDARAVIVQQLSQLTTAARRAVEVAAVCGLAFEAEVVDAVLDTRVEADAGPLEELRAAQVVREVEVGRFTFTHALVRQAVLDDMSRTHTARLHRRVAEELERPAPSGQSLLGAIAFHQEASGVMGDAATLFRTASAAGHDAFERRAFDESCRHFGTALAALDRMPANGARPR